MTIALGFNCPDGIVLCTDSLESDGVTKVLVDKIWTYETQDQWGIAVASAGDPDFADSFTDNLEILFSGQAYDKDKIMLTLRQAINAARRTYPDLEWEAAVRIIRSFSGESPIVKTVQSKQTLIASHKIRSCWVAVHSWLNLSVPTCTCCL